MPDGIYLNALELGPAKLALKINSLIQYQNYYYSMFKWHNYYVYFNPLEDPSASGICKLCALLNSKERRNEITVYKNIVKWFNDRKDWNTKSESETKGVNTLYNKIVTDDPENFEPYYGNNDDAVFAVTKHTVPGNTLIADHTEKMFTYFNIGTKNNDNTQTTAKMNAKDTTIRCPDVETCFKTLISNVKSKLASLLL